MTTLDELRRELHAQADATLDWPAPRLRRRSRRLRWQVPAAVLVSVVGVVALLVLVPRALTDAGRPPSADGPTSHPTPTHTGLGGSASTTASGPRRDWTAEKCRRTCTLPEVLLLDGRRYVPEGSGGSAPTRHPGAPPNPSLSLSVKGMHGWLLAGAEGSNSSSLLMVRFDTGDSAGFRGGKLSWLAVPEGAHTVVITEETRPLPSERLLLQHYVRVR